MADEKNPLPTVSPITVPADSTNDSNMNELGSLIQGVLQQTQDRFQHMSDQIIRRIDDMTTRIDDLEKNISDLLQSNQVEHPSSTTN
ncbi:Protein CBR-HSB-1 [Caenorhabditis briggsae]|uniref:Protein CBR-HSB-1 n=1 Tax=Caenorhabditis briggsae TaxID=6238 RepID=A8XI23_CAEBR|nr:Protein CBR-HSB-1 [Caenorhabditis briggsae]CAP32296.1 Protein CBR-HSB-1 [Caenorhabditis briggsae]